MRIASHATIATFGLIVFLAQGAAAIAAEVKVMAGAAMRGAFGELVPQFERATGHKIAIEYGAGTTLRKQIEAGETFDLVIIDSAEVDELIKQGKIAGDTRADIVRAAIGVAVREGAPKPDISSVDAFKKTLLSVTSVTYAPDALYGRQLSQAFDRLGIAEELKAKTKPNALARVAPALAAGEVELAIAGIPTLLSTKGVQIVGPLPGELQSWLVNTAGVSAAAKEPDAAKALISILRHQKPPQSSRRRAWSPLVSTDRGIAHSGAEAAGTKVDLITAITMNYAEEAVGLARAAKHANMPVVISFTVKTDGLLPTGQSLRDAIKQVDDATFGYPAYFMINCAHPSHFDQVVGGDEPWVERIRGLRANASRMSHTELNEAPELDAGIRPISDKSTPG